MKTKCPYCEVDLESCVGSETLGICPGCRELWTNEGYRIIMTNPCPKCKRTKAIINAECNWHCIVCNHQWMEAFEESKGFPEAHTIDFDVLLEKVKEELQAGDEKHGPMLEPIEGWYTTLCEITEWQREIFRLNKNPEAAKKECVQSICMHIKWLRDCLPMMIEEIKEKDNGDS